MTDCVFCRIVAGEIGATILYQDDKVMAFNDINPAAPKHMLVIPRRHLSDLMAEGAEDPALWDAMMKAVRHLARTEGIAGEGFRLVVNTGAPVGQTVPHLHLHILGGRKFTGFG